MTVQTKRKKQAKQKPEDETPLIRRIEDYISKYYDFRYNDVLNRVEFKNKDVQEYKNLTDYNVNSISREMMLKGINCPNSRLWNILHSNFTVVYNPFLQYLLNLPEWDGTTSYIDQLSSTVVTTDNELWKKCFKKWFVAVVGSLFKPEVVNHTVIILSGKQGLGKTTWLLNIVPSELRSYVYSGLINPNNKDTVIQLSECMLINMDELETLNRSEQNSVKELITKASIRLRRPYGHTMEFMPRRASFCGSVNGRDFLSDTTGNRRFLCFEALDINYKRFENLDLAYSEALNLFISGFRYWFDNNDIIEVNNSNEQFRQVSEEEELLTRYFDAGLEHNADRFMTATDVSRWMSENAGYTLANSSVSRFGRLLNAKKFLRTKKKGIWCYAMKFKNQDG